jgi:phosphomevalonate kinase
LTYIQTLQPNTLVKPSSIRILADQAYYSNPGVPRASNNPLAPEQTSGFLDFNVRLKDAHKTGLGSSAALVTSFTAAVLSFYLPKELFDIQSEKGLMILHNLAQASHSHAQGKVGSGFDIASAVFGSCLYKRFSPSLLSDLPQPSTPGFATQLRELIEGPSWDTKIKKSAIKMPKGLRLVMCDVDCGSETPGMVKKVLAWRSENPEEGEKNWKSLQEGNDKLAAELTRLATEGEGDGAAKYDKLRKIISSNRALIREMGEKSGVPIEPPQQSRLLDYCSKLEGVVGGVVPGAGGFDAIVLLVEDKQKAIETLKEALETYQDPEATGKVGVIGVREEMVGVKEEELSLYKEWKELS